MRGRKVLGVLALLAVAVAIGPAGASAWRVQGAADLFKFKGIPRQPGSFAVHKCGGPRTGLYSLGVFNLKLDRALDLREASIAQLKVDLPVTRRFRPGVIGASWINFHEYVFNRNEEHNIALA